MWGIKTHNMKNIHSFAAAEKLWNELDKFKGNANAVPLDGKRKDHMRLERGYGGDSYACVLYQTALVTYFADGHVELKVHDSTSSIRFADCVSPRGCSVLSHKGWMFWQINTPKGTQWLIPK